MQLKCEECGSAGEYNFFWHCRRGEGLATCLRCKVLNWFDPGWGMKTFRVFYVKGKNHVAEFVKAPSKQAAERFITGRYPDAKEIQVVVYKAEKQQYAYRGDSSGGI